MMSYGKVLATKGIKLVSRVSSAKRGVDVTMCCCINNLGQALPRTHLFSKFISNYICWKAFLLVALDSYVPPVG